MLSKDRDFNSLKPRKDKLAIIIGLPAPVVRQLQQSHIDEERCRGELEHELFEGDDMSKADHIGGNRDVCLVNQ